MLDGPDGAGKSTQARLLLERLQASGIDVLLLREPGGTAAGEAIRRLVLEQREIGLAPLTETFLFQAARAQLIKEVIEPALAAGKWVLCDRYTLSTLVYQGYAGGVPKDAVAALARLATQGLQPDLYLVVWVDAATGEARRAHRAADRMESKGSAFTRAVARGYRTEARRWPRRYTLIPGAGTIAGVQARIWKHVAPLLKARAK